MRSGYGHMVIDHTVARLRDEAAKRKERLGALASREDALAYQKHVQEIIRQAFGPFPERTPLNARVTGRIEGERYSIEKILFESRPGFLVSADLYLPKTTEKVPCVLGSCGHSPEGKSSQLYQSFCARLAHAGFAVLVFDPINQGERDQYIQIEDRSLVNQPTHAHNMMGKQLELLNDGFHSWRAWDGIRALDYLLSRPEVDSTRVGLTGNSGGGTLVTWLWALDDRYTMGAPSCFVTTFSRNLENEIPADAEQYPYGVVGRGLDMADFIIAGAPKPALVMGQRYDFFDPRGHQEAVDEIVDFYRLMGAPEGTAAGFRGPRTHGYWDENQREMVYFFAKHAGIENVEFLDAPQILPVEKLWAAPEGNVVLAGSKPIYKIISEEAQALAAKRPAIPEGNIRAVLAEMLSVSRPNFAPEYRHLRATTLRNRHYGRYAIETEGNIRALLYKCMRMPQYANVLEVEDLVTLYLPHFSAEIDLVDNSWSLELQQETELYALDVRGLGESIPDEDDDFWAPYGMDYMMHGHGILLAESYLGRRVYDVLVTVNLLRKLGAESVNLVGRGQGAIHAMLAAALDDDIATVTLNDYPSSWQEWAETPIVSWPSACFPRGVLCRLDVEDILRSLGNRVVLKTPCGPDIRGL